MKRAIKAAMAAALSIAWSAADAAWIVRTGSYGAMALDTRAVKEVRGGCADICYLTEGGAKVVVTVDGAAMLSATNSGSFAWHPLSKGEHLLTHSAGGETWTSRLNVTAVDTPEAPQPNPPENPNAEMAISPASADFGPEGGSNGIRTRATGSGTVEWTAGASADWITVEGSGSGIAGKANVRYSVAANPCTDARIGYIYVGGHVHSVAQSGTPISRIDDGASFEKDGGDGQFSVEAADGLAWKAYSAADWISVTNGCGSGSGTVKFTVAPWYEIAVRSGEIKVGGHVFTVEQRGKMLSLGTPLLRCTGSGGEFEVDVAAAAGVEWGRDKIDAPMWVEIVGDGAMSGSGRLVLRILENAGYEPRSAIVNVNGEQLRIEQEGRIDLEFESIVCGPGYGEYEVRVTAGAKHRWTAESFDAWYIELMAGEGSRLDNGLVEGTGPGSFVFCVWELENPVVPMNGWITVGDRTLYVTQKTPGTYSLPELEPGAGAEDVAAAIADAADASLKANVRTPQEYAAFRDWAAGLASAKEVKESHFAWLSYAFGQGGLMAAAPEAMNVDSIVSVENGGFEIAVRIEGIAVGDGAAVENLAKVIGVEGAVELDGHFSPSNLAAEVLGARGGKVKVRITPKDADARSFFVRAVLEH